MFSLLVVGLAVGVGAYSGLSGESEDGRDSQLAVNGMLTAGGDSLFRSGYDLSSHQTLSRVILLIRENYVDPDRVEPRAMFLAALDYIEKSVPEVIVEEAATGNQLSVQVGKHSRDFQLGELNQLWEVTMALRDIFRFMQGALTESTEERDIEYAAINGMLSTLDPHSVLLRPESFDEVKLSTKGEFGGLGIVISIRDDSLTIISPISGTPASRAGLKARDKIMKIGEESTVNMGLEEAVSRLRGKPGTTVDIWVKRKNWNEPRKFTLARAIIKIESVSSDLLDDSVGYIRIKNFQGNTYDDLNSHLEKLKIENKGQLKGLVLDLRNNPGGLLDQAILISDRFIDEGALVITVGEGNRTRDVKRAHFAGTETEYPVAILVNGGSASASEIVAGAIKNQNRGIVIGQQTFGKGSVQVLYDFKDNSALKLTIAQYLTPGDVSIQSVGIHPDVELVPVTAEKDAVHLFAQEDAPREKDLDKHLKQSASRIKTDGSTVATILHLLEPESDEESDDDRYATDELDLENDFEVQVAQELLAKATKVKRDELLGESAGLFKAHQTGQKDKIQARLEGFGLNWSKGPVVDAEKAGLEVEFVAKGQGKTALMAGDTIVLEAKVRNTGKEAVHQLRGVTDSENPYLDKIEFVFGKVMPGQAAVWSTDVKLPAAITPRGDHVKLYVGNSDDWRSGKKAELLVDIQELSKPHFSYRVQIDDRQGGNGDGLLQVGEVVECLVSVGNQGRGAARDAVVSAKNMSGSALFLEVGRRNLGELPVGGQVDAKLKFEVKSAPEDGFVELRLSIWDSELGASLTNVLKLPVAVQRTSKRSGQVVKITGEKEVPVRVATSDESEILGYLKPGARAKSEATFQQAWRRVRFGKDRFGFVPFEKTKPAKGKPSKKALGLAALQSAPVIFMDIPSLQVEEPSLALSAKLADNEGLKDVYVFVNDSKVYYQSLVDARRLDDQVVAQLDITVPLEAGDNTISVIVRETDTLVSRKAFTVYRTSKDTVAQREVDNDSRRHQ